MSAYTLKIFLKKQSPTCCGLWHNTQTYLVTLSQAFKKPCSWPCIPFALKKVWKFLARNENVHINWILVKWFSLISSHSLYCPFALASSHTGPLMGPQVFFLISHCLHSSFPSLSQFLCVLQVSTHITPSQKDLQQCHRIWTKMPSLCFNGTLFYTCHTAH